MYLDINQFLPERGKIIFVQENMSIHGSGCKEAGNFKYQKGGIFPNLKIKWGGPLMGVSVPKQQNCGEGLG